MEQVKATQTNRQVSFIRLSVVNLITFGTIFLLLIVLLFSSGQVFGYEDDAAIQLAESEQPPIREPVDFDPTSKDPNAAKGPIIAKVEKTSGTASDGDFVYATLAYSDVVDVVDVATQVVTKSIDVGIAGCDFPWRATMSPDGSTVYTSCYNSGNIVVIETTGNSVVTTVNGIPNADGIAFTRDGSLALVGSRQASQITIVDTTTYLTSTLSTPSYVRSMSAHPYLDKVYATSGDDNILVVDVATMSISATIPIGNDPWDVDVSHDGQWVFTGSRRGGGGLGVIDARDDTVHTTVTGLGNLNGLAVAPDNSVIYVSNLWNGIHVVDMATFNLLTTIPVVGTVWEVEVTKDGSELYASNALTQVLVVDTNTLTITKQITMTGNAARGIVINPQYVASGAFLNPPTQTNNGLLGQVVTFEETLANATGISDSFTLTLGSHVWNSTLSVTKIGPINEGHSLTFTVSVTVPMVVGQNISDTVVVTATSVTSPAIYSDTALLTTQAVLPRPLTVNNLGDTNDANPGDGSCADSSGNCTLRAAISEANALSGADIIDFSVHGTINLSGTGDDTNASGDLDISEDLTINGNGTKHTIINANSVDRVIHVTSAATVVFNDLTLQNGNVTGNGGGIFADDSGANVTISNSALRNNTASLNGGGFRGVNGASLTANNSTISGNTSSIGDGGAVSGQVSLAINNSTVSNNTAGDQGGGIVLYGPWSGTIVNSSIISNTSNSIRTGGGIAHWTTITITNSILAYNSPDNCTTGGSTNLPTSNGYNIVSDASCSFANTGDQNSTNPQLGLLEDNGGPTETHAPLSSSSPAIDQIPDANCTSAPINGIDQRGAARNFDGDSSPSSSECDVGPHEYRGVVQQCSMTANTNYAVNGITFNFSSFSSLACVNVEQMGSDHLLATGPAGSNLGIKTGNWWHITGEDSGGSPVNSGFSVTMTLSLTGADILDRVCKWPGSLDGHGWDCDDGTNTTFGSNTITRKNVTSFSDWAAGDFVGPTAVNLQNLLATGEYGSFLVMVIGTLTVLGGTFWLWRQKQLETKN